MASQVIHPKKVSISVYELASKMRSKREVFNALTVGAQAYLPSNSECLTIYFLKDLISGAKKYLKCQQLQHMYCPQYPGLELESILKWAKSNQKVWKYLPDERDIPKLPKQWVVNVIYSVCGEVFSNFVKQKIDERNQKVAVEKDLMVDIDPDIAQAFLSSSTVSSKYLYHQVAQSFQNILNYADSKGSAVMLLKRLSKRRKSKAELAEDKARKNLMEQEIQSKLQQMEQLDRKVGEMQDEISQGATMKAFIQKMIDDGKLIQDEVGNVSYAEDISIIKHESIYRENF